MSKFSDRMRRLSRKLPPIRLRPEILLGGNIPPPMHGLAPRVVMGRKWWDKTRKAAAQATRQHCLACGVSKWQAKGRQYLEGHEVFDIDYLLGRMVYVETVPLCHFCHSYIHDGLLRILLATRKISHARYVAIIQHGDEVLRRANLVRSRPETLGMAEWDDWRMVFEGREYPPLKRGIV